MSQGENIQEAHCQTLASATFSAMAEPLSRGSPFCADDAQRPTSYNTRGMWHYRDLVRNLTLAELKNRYQNTALGFFWSILSPLLFAGVLYFFFRHLFGAEENFAVNLMVGVMAWRFFSLGTSSCLGAVVSKASLVTKVYVPRHILVLSTALAGLISSFLEFIVLLFIILGLLGHLPVTVLLFPVVHLVYFWFVFGAGLLLSALFVYFRDVNQIWEVLVNVLFFCTPVFYPISIVPDYLMPYYQLNPVTQFIVIYRGVMVAGNLPSPNSIVIVIAFAIAAYLVGSLVFNKLQRRFAEEI